MKIKRNNKLNIPLSRLLTRMVIGLFIVTESFQTVLKSQYELPLITSRSDIKNLNIKSFFNLENANINSLVFTSSRGSIRTKLKLDDDHITQKKLEDKEVVLKIVGWDLRNSLYLTWNGECKATWLYSLESPIKLGLMWEKDCQRTIMFGNSFFTFFTNQAKDGELNIQGGNSDSADQKIKIPEFKKNDILNSKITGKNVVFYRVAEDETGSYGENLYFLSEISKKLKFQKMKLMGHFTDYKPVWVNIIYGHKKSSSALQAFITYKDDQNKILGTGLYDLKEDGSNLIFNIPINKGAIGVAINWLIYYEIDAEKNTLSHCSLNDEFDYQVYSTYKKDCVNYTWNLKLQENEVIKEVEYFDNSLYKAIIIDRVSFELRREYFALNTSKYVPYLPSPTQVLSLQDFDLLAVDSSKDFPISGRVKDYNTVLDMEWKEIQREIIYVTLTGTDKDSSAESNFKLRFVKEFSKFKIEIPNQQFVYEAPESEYIHKYWSKPVHCSGDLIDSDPLVVNDEFESSFSPYFLSFDPYVFQPENPSVNTYDSNKLSDKNGDSKLNCLIDEERKISISCENGKLLSLSHPNIDISLTYLKISCESLRCFKYEGIALITTKPPLVKTNNEKIYILRLTPVLGDYEIRSLNLNYFESQFEINKNLLRLSYFKTTNTLIFSIIEKKSYDEYRNTIHHLKISFDKCYLKIKNLQKVRMSSTKHQVLVKAKGPLGSTTQIAVNILSKPNPNRLLVFIKKKVKYNDMLVGVSFGTIRNYFSWIGNGLELEFAQKKYKSLIVDSYKFYPYSTETEPVYKVQTSNDLGDDNTYLCASVSTRSKYEKLKFELNFDKFDNFLSRKTDYSAMYQFEGNPGKMSFVQIDKKNICWIGIIQKIENEYSNRVYSSHLIYPNIQKLPPQKADLGPVENIEFLTVPYKKYSQTDLQVLVLGKNKSLGLYQFSCGVTPHFEKILTVGENVTSLAYLADTNFYIPFVMIFSTTNESFTNGGLKVTAFDIKSPNKTYTIDLSSIQKNLSEVSTFRQVSLYYNMRKRSIDFIFDGAGFTFYHITAKLNFDVEKKSIELLEGNIYKYQKSFMSENFGCKTSKDFIICGGSGQGFDKSAASSNPYVMIYNRKDGDYGSLEDNGYASDSTSYSSTDFFYKTTNDLFAVTDYNRNYVAMSNKWQSSASLRILRLSTGREISRQHTSIDNSGLELYGNQYGKLKKEVKIHPTELFSDYQDIKNKSYITPMKIVGSIFGIVMLYLLIRMCIASRKEKKLGFNRGEMMFGDDSRLQETENEVTIEIEGATE